MCNPTAKEAYPAFLTDLRGWLIAETRHTPELQEIVEKCELKKINEYEHILKFSVPNDGVFNLAFREKGRFALEIPKPDFDYTAKGIPPGKKDKDGISIQWCYENGKMAYSLLYQEATWACLSTFALRAVRCAWQMLGEKHQDE